MFGASAKEKHHQQLEQELQGQASLADLILLTVSSLEIVLVAESDAQRHARLAETRAHRCRR